MEWNMVDVVGAVRFFMTTREEYLHFLKTRDSSTPIRSIGKDSRYLSPYHFVLGTQANVIEAGIQHSQAARLNEHTTKRSIFWPSLMTAISVEPFCEHAADIYEL